MGGDSFDILVVGSGIAGLCAALGTVESGARVAVITKGALDDGCSREAQGGIAAAVDAEDSPEQHLADTLAAGGGLCDERAVRILVEEGPRRVLELVSWGVSFDTQDGVLLTTREAAHTRSRIIHARGDATGLEIENALIARLRASSAAVLERQQVVRLLRAGGRCAGVQTASPGSPGTRLLTAGSVILASGGAGRLWLQTTNPPPATGDGVALAYQAGATVASLEFVQFHPTVLALKGAPRFLISEAVRGEGAHIVNGAGERFLFAADQRGEMAPRDVVSQAIWSELERTSSSFVHLDCRPLGARAALRFPTIHRTCLSLGIDITTDLVPVAPAAHYLVGGVRTDVDGSTDLPGLYACGEVACSGVHGANRLASNSLLESVVFARRAAAAAVAAAVSPPLASAVEPPPDPPPRGPDTDPLAVDPPQRLRQAMWEGAGVVRNQAGLTAAVGVLDELIGEAAAGRGPGASGLGGVRLRQAALCARLVCAAALARQESRGCHLRCDFPDLSDNWKGLWAMNQELGAHLDSHA